MYFTEEEWSIDFISQEDFINHVKDTLIRMYDKKERISLKKFNKNIIDPIKLTFDSFMNGLDKKELINTELSRQIDKSITNEIGYFHQYIFKYIDGWNVPKEGFDIENKKKGIYVELKNKHNTMNSASGQKVYINLQRKLLEDEEATCMLVEIIATKSQNIPWKVMVDKKQFNHKKIRRVSIDKFYELATGDETAFQKICSRLPIVIKRLNEEMAAKQIENKIIEELNEISDSFLEAIYLLAFKSYNGFQDISFIHKDELNDSDLF